MKYLLTPILIFVCFFAKAQNIVPNPNFALHSSCPSYGPGKCNSWTSPTIASPDYRDTCLGVPVNDMGTQSAFGNAYWAVFTYSGLDYREYIKVDIPALKKRYFYKVTIRVSLADSSYYATDGFGVFFYEHAKPDSANNKLITDTPQIDYLTSGIINDDTNWVALTDTFMADSAYTHLVVGCFKSNSSLHTVLCPHPHPFHHYQAYYYIDSVAVEELSYAGPDPDYFSSLAVVPFEQKLKTTLSPNPVTGGYATLNVEHLAARDSYDLSIFNLQGVIVRKYERITEQKLKIQKDDLPNGFYSYQLRATNNMVINGKMMFQ